MCFFGDVIHSEISKASGLFVLSSSKCKMIAMDLIWTVSSSRFLFVLPASPVLEVTRTKWARREGSTHLWPHRLGWLPCPAQELIRKGNWNRIGGTVFSPPRLSLCSATCYRCFISGHRSIWHFQLCKAANDRTLSQLRLQAAEGADFPSMSASFSLPCGALLKRAGTDNMSVITV